MVSQVQSIEDLITSLLDCSTTYQSSPVILLEIAESLKTIGQHQPTAILNACHKYFLHNPRLPPGNKAFVFKVVNTVVGDSLVTKTLDEQLVLLIINLATQEMTMSKETETEFADAAKDVLVTIGKCELFVSRVIEAVLLKFPPGVSNSPHKYVVLCLAAIAQYNPSGLIPFLTDILSRTVHLLPHIKTDPLRCAWARALCSFCEAIRERQTERPTEAVEDLTVDTKHDLSVSNDSFDPTSYSDQSGVIYDVVFQWMYSKDAVTRAEAAECVGELCLVIPTVKIIEDIKKLVQTLTGLYKKAYSEHLMITIALCRFLEATCADERIPLEHYLEDILNALFPNACVDLDDMNLTLNEQTMKNHSEALRCFHVASRRFADKIVYYLLHKMQHLSDLQKLGAINVLRHLLNYSGQYIEDKRSLVMMGLKKLLGAEQSASIKVKRAVVQLCIALADHAYVDAEGGDHVISFLVRNLVLPSEQEAQVRKLEVDVAGSNQLRTQCAQALHTITSTCVCANKLLWPYLLEFVCSDRYSPVIGDIFKCLRILITREIEEGREVDYITGFDNPKIAGKYAVLARLIVCMCNAPANGLITRRARESLNLLRTIAPWLHPAVVETIESYTERMEPLLDELSNVTVSSPTSEFSPAVELRGRRISRWHDIVLEMLCACLSSVSDGNWRAEVTSAFAKQLDLYKESPDEKAFLLRCIGTSLSKIASKPFVIDHFLMMFKSTQHNNATERQGCARGVGACASVHIETILVELENVAKWEHVKRSSGFFGFIKDAMPMRQYSDIEMVYLRATIMLSYGHVVMACPIDTVTQRLQNTIIAFLRQYFANSKQETVVREAMLETMRLIAMAVNPARLGVEYKLDCRNELLEYIRDYVQSENAEVLSSSLRLLASKAFAALVRLQPALSDDDMFDFGQILTQYILPMHREKSGLKTLAFDLFDYATSSFSVLSSDNSSSHYPRKIEDDESATIMDATVSHYGSALEAMVYMKPTVNTVTILLKLLHPFYGKSAEHERSRAIDTTVLILRVYYEYAEDIVLGHANDFTPLSSLLARLTPRIADSLSQIRHQSLRAIHWSLRLAHVHKGHGRDTNGSAFDIDEFIRLHLMEEGKLDGQTAKRAIKSISEIIDARLPQSQMQLYITRLIKMLTDRQSHVSSSAAQLLTYSLQARGDLLINEGETLVTTLMERLPDIHKCVQTYTDVMAALVAFAAHQLHTVCDALLQQPLPLALYTCDAWGCLSRDRTLFPSIIDHLLELLTSSFDSPYEVLDTGGGNSVKVVKIEPCQYVSALAEVVKNGEPEWTLNERVPNLLSALLHHVCCVADTQFPLVKESKDGTGKPAIITNELRKAVEKPVGLPLNAIKRILYRLSVTNVVEDMNQARGWTECLDREQFISSLSQLVRSIAEHRPDWIEQLWICLAEKAESEHEPIRLAAVVAASALIKNCPDSQGEFNEKLLVECIRLLQNELTDQSLRVRKLCLRGLGEIAECSSETVTKRFASMAVEAAMAGLDDIGDRQDTVAMESILALSKLVSRTSDQQLTSILPFVLLKIRPCFEKESADLRAACFSLFGELGSRVGDGSNDFLSHLQTNIISILLHVNDENDEVKKMCTSALYRVYHLMNVSALSALVEHETPDGRLPSSYISFIQHFAAVLTSSFPDRVNQYALTCSIYFKSSCVKIRSNAAALIGCLLSDLSPQLRATISKDLIFSGLVLLLKDEDLTVRLSATKSIASLHSFS
ncbi:unnamed protein product [Auanema sp. JU1783]|nr:unnamed protein product [Auanema sp. JU1783]